jgi:hypothetical protein
MTADESYSRWRLRQLKRLSYGFTFGRIIRFIEVYATW